MGQLREYVWRRIGAPTGGAVTSLVTSPTFGRDGIVYAATMTGLFSSSDSGQSWQRVGAGRRDMALTAVAISPDSDQDSLVLVASLDRGLWRITDHGTTWVAGDFQGRAVDISALAISPNVTRDGTVFAATIGDGVFVSRNRGASWEQVTFGLLDLEVTALAVSPTFGQDDTVFAATATGIFRSPNGGRAWREVMIPTDSPAVLCLGLSPSFGSDGIAFAGTEGGGLLRSRDKGATWQPIGPDLSDACINALALSPRFPDDHMVMVATDSVVYMSNDEGETWRACVEAPGALCLVMAADHAGEASALVGLSYAGILRSTANLSEWQTANEGLTAHRLTDLALSPAFGRDQVLAASGVGAGVLWSDDGGVIWADLADALPSLEVTSMAIGIGADGVYHLYAALPEGVWEWESLTGRWQQIFDRPTRWVVVSPTFASDSTIIVGTENGDIWTSIADWQDWRSITIPWGAQEILALATSPYFERDRRIFVTIRRPGETTMEVWQVTETGGWKPLLAYNNDLSCASIAMSPTIPWDGKLYAALGDQVYGPISVTEVSSRSAQMPTGSPVTADRPVILVLVTLPGEETDSVLAVTEHNCYIRQSNSRDWQAVDKEHGPQAIRAVVPVPSAASRGVAYVLDTGGSVWQLRQSATANQPPGIAVDA